MGPEDYPLIGLAAQVSVAIPTGGVGEVMFVTADNRRREPACALDGRPVERGAEVIIARWDRGIAIVQRAEAPAQETDTGAAAARAAGPAP